MAINDKRIGTLEQFPEVDINGRSYSRPVSTIALGHEYIAVLNGIFSLDDIDELKTIVSKTRGKQKRGDKKQNVHSKDEQS